MANVLLTIGRAFYLTDLSYGMVRNDSNTKYDLVHIILFKLIWTKK